MLLFASFVSGLRSSGVMMFTGEPLVAKLSLEVAMVFPAS